TMFHKIYKTILNQIPTGVIVIDKKYNVLYSNDAFRRLFPLGRVRTGRLASVIGCRKTSFCGKGSHCGICPVLSAFRPVMEEGSPSSTKLTIPTLDGRRLSVRMNVTPLDKYYLGILSDGVEVELVKELQTAQNIQRRLLPAGREAGGIGFSYFYLPCREIGGDLPDVYEVDRGTVGMIADVSGKGISAGMLSAFVKAGWDKTEPSPARAISGLNKKFAELNMDELSYITAEAVNVNPDERTITYSTAGHVVPILLKSGFRINEIAYKSPPISNWMTDFCYQDNVIPYEYGDILVLLTDGVVESKNVYGEQFGVERVESILLRSPSAKLFIERLKAELHEFCEDFDDDLTAIAFDL
ncbi:MAG: SpoIIE family protein phosphatase, partial [Christensenellaceae bacterium]